jgi:2Fe-2S ferredoxin
MPKVTFISQDGQRTTISDADGSLMEVARDNDIEGIEGDCGGVCSCSTCHVYVDEEWMSRVGAPEDLEADTLDFNAHKKPCSRLSCQIELTDALDGLVVRVAPADE